MNIQAFPHCCTATILTGFGESRVADSFYNVKPTKSQIKDFIKREIDRSIHSGDAMITVATNNEQKTVNAVLRELGFKYSKWLSKTTHPETKVRLWWYEIN